jgi:hypothetical protein
MRVAPQNPLRNGEGDRSPEASGGGGPRILQTIVAFLLAAAVSAPALAAPSQSLIDRTEEALVEQVRCDQPPQPARAINAMLRNKLIRYADNEDMVYMFVPTKPLRFLGLPIKLVSGFDDKPFHGVPDSRLFTTAPPISFEIDVAAPASILKKRALDAGLVAKRVWISSGGDYTSHFGGKIRTTSSITCLSP